MLPYYKFYKKTPYSSETQQQIWSTIFTDTHDLHCGCTEPVGHFLNEIIPPDHPDRHITVDQLIYKTYKRTKCLSGGTEEKGGGEGVTDPSTKEETSTQKERKDFEDIDAEDLLAAATAAEER